MRFASKLRWVLEIHLSHNGHNHMTPAPFSRQGRTLAFSVLAGRGSSGEQVELAHHVIRQCPMSIEFLENVMALAASMLTNPDLVDEDQMATCQILLGHLMIIH